MDERIGYQGEAPARAGTVGVLLVTGLPGAADRPLAVVDLQVVVGREDDCDVILPSPRVSRRHARVWAHGELFGVEDLGSLNGTYVNRRRVAGNAMLTDGDRLTLADVELQFRVLPAHAVPTPRRSTPAEAAYPRGVTTLMPPAGDRPAAPAEPVEDLRSVHLVVALVAALAGAVLGHLLGVGRTGALVLAVVLPLAAGAALLRPAGLRRAAAVVALAVVAASLTVTGVTAAELREGHAVLPNVGSGGTFVNAVQLDRALDRPSPPAECGPEPTVAVASATQPGGVALRVSGRCFGPGSSVDVLVGPTVMTTARADRFGRIATRVLVDPDASCPLGRCPIALHELQSLRYQETHTDVAPVR
ncbi:MAG TPA: FHA domain-containing protein [Kineosporiaceae bacterium]|nr:FHA domain-containing protein [Kineosporiaceae bacterium]